MCTHIIFYTHRYSAFEIRIDTAIPNHKPHWANFGLRAYIAHSRARRDTQNDEWKNILHCLLTPRRVTANLVIGPFMPPNILDDLTFPEIGWRYLVEDKVVFPLVRILQTQQSRLVIPVQRTKLLIGRMLALRPSTAAG